MDGKQRRVIIPLVAVVIVLCVIIVGLVISLRGSGEAADDDSGTGNPVLDYAQGVTIVDDESSLQAAVDKMMEDAEKEMVVSYQNQAVSEDGKTFSCYIANSEYNEYDMFISLYSDLNMDTDPLYLSGLMRPGEAFREITLDEPLEKGVHTLNLVMTQVEDDHTTLHGQSIVELQMEVS